MDTINLVSLVCLMDSRSIEFGSNLRGILCGADGKRGPVIISHGAGRGMGTPLLEKTAETLAALGFVTLRFNFSYIDRKAAPSKDGKNERPELVAAIDYMKQHGQPILVGKSFGARISTYVAAERDDVRALAFYGLPLVGISKNAKARDWSHLRNIYAPMLFLTGDKDKLCPLDQLKSVQVSIRSPYSSEVVKGDHSFRPKSEDEAIGLCVAWIDALPT